MTDKEQIIINGIDYTNALEDYLNDCIVDYCKSAHCDIEMAKDIILFPVAKRIEKLQQENEKLKEGYAKLTEIVSPYMSDFTGYDEETNSFDILLCIKELLEEFKSSNGFWSRATSEMKIQRDKYKQALEEIKEICLNDVHTFADGTELRYDSLNDILDIINKAKGE